MNTRTQTIKGICTSHREALKQNKVQHASELPVQTPDILLYSEILDRLKTQYIDKGVSFGKLEQLTKVPKASLVETFHKKRYPQSLLNFVKLIEFLDIDIENFGYEITDKHSSNFPKVEKQKKKFQYLTFWIDKGLKRNIYYRKPMYLSNKEFANFYTINESFLYKLDTKNIIVPATQAIRLAVKLKKNFKRLAYDGYVQTNRFNPY